MKIFKNHWAAKPLLIAGLFTLVGCTHNEDTQRLDNQPVAARPAESDDDIVKFSQERPGAAQPGQRTFASPEEAASVFKDAVQTMDRRTLVALFGNEGRQLIFSGDRVQETNDLRAFGQRMSEYLHVDRPSDNAAVLHVGSENWPFPIPLINAGQGWFFDTVAGRDELLNRRIGEDELNAIAVCRAFVNAQKEYARRVRSSDGVVQYAQHFMSTPGTKDGLYWEAGPGEEISPMGPLVAEAQMEGYPTTRSSTGTPHPYQGYIFHILKAQGDAAPGGKMSYVVDGKMTKGFALVASPSKYGASGIMTFVVAQDGKVFEKNLGPQSSQAVSNITEYNPDQTWTEVKD